jgi:hypothetical protein
LKVSFVIVAINTGFSLLIELKMMPVLPGMKKCR